VRIHIFSQYNEKSVALAEDITAVYEEKTKFEELSDITKPDEGEELSLYLIKNNEQENIKDAVILTNKYKGYTDIALDLFIFSTIPGSAAIIDSLDKGNIKIHLVDPNETAAYNLLYEHPMFADADTHGSEELTVLIVGSGKMAETCLKAVLWCGRMKSRRLKLHFIGPDADKTEMKLKLYNPGLFDQEVQSNQNMKELGLIKSDIYSFLKLTRMKFYKADTDSQEFEIQINNALMADYIIVDCGDDFKTLETARYIRAHFIRKHIVCPEYRIGGRIPVVKLPAIYPHIKDAVLSSVIQVLKAEGQEPIPGDDEMDLRPFGSIAYVFSAKNIIDWEIDKLAAAMFPPESDPRQTESARRAHRASAVHTIYKLRDINFIENPGEGNYDEREYKPVRKAFINEELENRKYELAALEHQRWNIFMLTEGWIPADSYCALIYGKLNEDGKREHRQYAGKMNAALIETSALSNVAGKLKGSVSYFTEFDRNLVVSLFEKLSSIRPDFKMLWMPVAEPD